MITYIVAFFSGALVLLLEILAGRLLAPFFGNTLLSWTAIISTTLLALSLGYLLGSWRAYWLRPLLLLAALHLATLSVWLKPTWLHRIYDMPIWLAPLLLSLALLFLPLLVLGMFSPYLVARLHQRQAHPATHAVGLILAFSTLGSLVGALLTAYWLIPTFRLSHILQVVATLLLLLAWWEKPRDKRSFLLLLLIWLQPATPLPAGVIWQSQNHYQQHLVLEADGKRSLILDRSLHGMVDTQHNFDSSMAYFKIGTWLQSTLLPLSHALVIGGGAYILPRHLLQNDATIAIDVIEIDPEVMQLAHTYFDLPPSPRLQTHHHDARIFLAKHATKWPLIWLDAFGDYTRIPSHYLTQEFMQQLQQHLSRHGVLMINTIVRTQGDDPVDAAISTTLKSVFSRVDALCVQESYAPLWQNCIYIIGGTPDWQNRWQQTYMQHSNATWRSHQQLPSQGVVLTDDFNPIESLAQKVALE